MNLKDLKLQILRSFIRRLLLKIIMFWAAMIAISFLQIATEIRKPELFGLNLYFNFTLLLPNPIYIPLFGMSVASFIENKNLTKNVFMEVTGNGFLDSNAKALCVGEGADAAVLALQELGFSHVFGINVHPSFSLLRMKFVYEMEFEDNYFDFVFSRALDRVSVPALLVLEMERLLRPGGTGAMLVGASNFYSAANLVRLATPVSSFLKSSDVVHVCSVGSFTLVLFKKRLEGAVSFEQFRLPDHCPALVNNKAIMCHIEPLANKKPARFKPKISLLPGFMNISSRNRLVYLNVGAGEFVETTVKTMLKPHYPISHLDVFVVDHNASALSSYVKTPGVTFVYHPTLSGKEISLPSDDEEFVGAPMDEEKGFDFTQWFEETVSEGDFVVLMMNAREAELQILCDLFKTGLICRVDELFLHCSDTAEGKHAGQGDCTSLLRSLRNSGVFAHRWWGD
uniref:Peptide upstream protein n=1 Tax=Ipomoea pes-caprae TaxID=89656 RepID=A0A2Z4HN44_IPOPC|nr:peptide upstream protein [Ipomoea pes-caprae]